MGPTMGPMNPAKTFSATYEGKHAIFSTILNIAFIQSKTLPPVYPALYGFTQVLSSCVLESRDG